MHQHTTTGARSSGKKGWIAHCTLRRDGQRGLLLFNSAGLAPDSCFPKQVAKCRSQADAFLDSTTYQFASYQVNLDLHFLGLRAREGFRFISGAGCSKAGRRISRAQLRLGFVPKC